MQCPACNIFLEDETVFCGNCGRQVRPLQAKGETLNYSLPGEPASNPSYGQQRGTAQSLPEQHAQGGPPPMARPFTPPLPVYNQTPPPPVQPPSAPQPGRRVSLRVTVLVAVLILVLAGGTVLALALTHAGNNSAGANASGQIAFLDSASGASNTDTLRISISGLQAPASGSSYDAWLINTTSEQVTPLGTLKASGKTFSLNFTTPSKNGQPGANLLSLGDEILVTLETGQVSLPGGSNILSASFPPKAVVHIKHLLFSFPTTPTKIGLLVGLLQQTRLLSAQAQVLQGIETNGDAQSQKCIAQSILDISEGLNGANYSPLAASCGSSTAIGDGFGILGTNGYAATAATHAALAASQSDTTAVIRLHASEVEAATTNITNWVTTIQKDALTLLNGQVSKTAIDEIATLAQQTQLGVDANGNGQIEPISKEAGAATAYLSGQQMATLTLTPAQHS